jgi:hypothetical protein
LFICIGLLLPSLTLSGQNLDVSFFLCLLDVPSNFLFAFLFEKKNCNYFWWVFLYHIEDHSFMFVKSSPLISFVFFRADSHLQLGASGGNFEGDREFFL